MEPIVLKGLLACHGGYAGWRVVERSCSLTDGSQVLSLGGASAGCSYGWRYPDVRRALGTTLTDSAPWWK